MRVITDDERRARLAIRHALAPAARLGSVAEAVTAMTCFHATEPANVYLSAFVRCGASRAEIDRVLHDERSVVRQLAMRRTVFVFPRGAFPAVRASAAARVAGQLATRLAKEVEAGGLADDGVAWVQDTCAAVLARVRRAPATTAQLRGELPALSLRLSPPDGHKYGYEGLVAPRLMSTLAAGGSVVRGRNNGHWKLSRPYWTAVEEWLGEDPPALESAAGYADLVGQWLWTFGPGTENDLVWWLGATKGIVRAALADVGAVAAQLEDGRAAWLHPDDVAVVDAPQPWAALLPALDPTTMGWKERDFYLGSLGPELFDRNGNGGPSAWWNGRIVGGWTQSQDGTVIVLPAVKLPAEATAALAVQATALTTWLGGDVVRSVYQSPIARAFCA